MIQSSYLIPSLAEDIYKRGTPFSLLEVETFWTVALDGFSDSLRWSTIAYKATFTLSAFEQDQVRSQLRQDQWASYQEFDQETLWPDPLPESPNLEALRAAALRRVDAEAEVVRSQFLTPGAGQCMTYLEKYGEAVAYQADPNIDPALIPHLIAEVGITGETVADVAAVVIGVRGYWKDISPIIEQRRLSAKAAIAAAETTEALGIASTVDWTLQ